MSNPQQHEDEQRTMIWQQSQQMAAFVQSIPSNVVSGDILYNSISPVSGNVCYPETYFLKVYHCAETQQTPHVHHQQTPHLHQQQQMHHQIPPTFNNYELFSSNTIVSPPQQETVMIPSQSRTSEHPSVVFIESSGMQCAPETFNSNEFCSNNADINISSNSTNMIINKLVNNWSPNLTGGAYSHATISNLQSSAQQQPLQETQLNNSILMKSQIDAQSSMIKSSPLPVPANSQPDSCAEVSGGRNFIHQEQTHQNLSQQQFHLQHNAFQGSCGAKTNGSLENHSQSVASNAILQDTVTKKRIIAEVKPMRMTYSDVLSKVNNKQPIIQASAYNAQTKSVSKSMKQQQQQQNTLGDRRGVVNSDDGRNSNMNSRRQEQAGNKQAVDDNQISNGYSKQRRSPIHENKENIQQQHQGIIPNKITRKINATSSANQKPQKPKQNIANYNAGAPENGISRKRSNKRDIDGRLGSNEPVKNSTAGASTKSSSAAGGGKEDKDSYYNVTAAKTGSSCDRSSKSSTSNNNSVNCPTQTNNSNSKKTSSSRQASSGITSNSFSHSNRSFASQRQQGYSYSSKRGGGQQYHHRNTKFSNKYELAHKFLEYTFKILTWLFYLIYDIVVLGFSVGYERISHYYALFYTYALLLRNDLKNNSNKPSIWLKNYLKQLDSRFKKTSKWAFWRNFYKKKPVEKTPEYVKTGRLPQTADEAMYSLLNCKGKDAYSILGVPVDSSQEQIRKHYKKIAVLVHPDKNKQPGAEEAFKVLQRAFELIGEPENRQGYDQSLVEALNAEKAWSELHDLLSQLQSKITEAANTIRCSSCALRHPRKITDRAHYAARECASCKIRHSAREGDIWAETSLFGLRWNYLALMEGKVYDITEWAHCQKGALSHLEPNSHIVQYRIVRGAQQQQQHHQQQQNQKQQPQQHPQHNSQQEKSRTKRGEPRRCEASLDDFLDNLYSGQNPHGQQSAPPSRRRCKRN